MGVSWQSGIAKNAGVPLDCVDAKPVRTLSRNTPYSVGTLS